MYPNVFRDFAEHQRKYGNVSVLPTPAFFYGLPETMKSRSTSIAARHWFISVPTIQGMVEGGLPILVNGQCVGAVGVSGVKSPQDAQVARAGIAALEN